MPPLYRSGPYPCPYLPDREAVNLMFFSGFVSPEDWETLLETGWRRFGKMFFRPDCPNCRECKPIRIPTADFIPSASQKKALARNRTSVYQTMDIRTLLSHDPAESEKQIIEAAWRIYKQHGETRFETPKDNFKAFVETFFTPAVESLFCLYYTGTTLAGTGFVDLSPRAVSSVYFSFDPVYSRLSPGTWSALKEIELVRETGRKYYYLGYWISDCAAMTYKARFRPHELYNWETETWEPVTI